MSDTLITLKTRRSCRAYKPEHVEEEKLQAILEAGTYAPTGMGKQSPIILVIKDQETRQKLAKLNAAAMGMDIDPFYGAPDLVVEILSPSNSESKMNEKMLKYRDAGVPEYWAVNYDNKSITVILFEDAEGNAQIHFYTFSDKVPVSIFEDCFIDFAEIDAYVQKYIDKCEGRD